MSLEVFIMMTGVDIVQISRIEKLANNKRESFLNRIFTDNEIAYIDKKGNNSKTIAGLFAAKEAISKALGTGIGQVSWKNLEIYHDDKGKPLVSLSSNLTPLLDELGLNNNKFEVLLGNATIRIDRKYLKLAKTTETPIVKSTGINVTTKASVSSTLDLRGKRFEEAKDLIDKFLDDAIYANFNTVSIIHGFGTGVIRKLVIDELKANKNVESYRYGGAGEGGQGVTIAIMKQ